MGASGGGSGESFYFESDHVALKDNDDYRRLLRAFVTLQSQRTAAVNELDQLLALQHAALRDPLMFAAKLRRGDLQLTSSSRVVARSPAALPVIAWQRYTDDVEAVLASLQRQRLPGTSTRRRQKRQLMTGITSDYCQPTDHVKTCYV